MRGKRCLILGGRQSAFEWAALLHEAGTAEVHVSHRHDSPEFAVADWSWVNPLVDAMAENPGWFRSLTQQEKDAVSRRLWAEGRLKVEPWLKARILQEGVTLWPRTQITDCVELATGDVATKMDNGQKISVDHIILATGYKVNIARVPFLVRVRALHVLPDRIESGKIEVEDDPVGILLAGATEISVGCTFSTPNPQFYLGAASARS
jgi:cation diffusion facilitator CzcD-associated flavoprotein CzcO